MPVTNYTSLLGLALPTTGDLAGTWGDTVNNSITSLIDSAVAGTTTVSTDADVTLSTTSGAANQARQMILVCSGSRTAQRTITAPAASKAYIVINATTGGFAVKVVGAGPTTGVTIANGRAEVIAWNGSDFITVASNSVSDLLGFGTGVLTAVTTNVGTAGSIVVNGGVLGTPSSGTLTNCTGLPASTGISGLGTGVATALGQNVSGSTGGIVLSTGASLTTPSLSGETFSTSATVSAAGTTQGTATALTSDYNVVTTAAANSGVVLPTATTGRWITVVNRGANAVNVYPASGGQIDALGANAAISVPVNGYIQFNASSTTQWYSSFNLYTPGGGVTSFSAGTTGFTPSTATTGAITLAGTLAAANGGTGQSSYTVGDILYASTTTALSRLADVATGNALLSGGVGVAPAWGKVDLTTTVTGTLPTANGGTGLGGGTPFTANGAVYATSTSALTTGTLPVGSGGTGQTTYTDGQLLIGNSTGNTLTKATLTAGSNVSITNGSGSITIAATGGGQSQLFTSPGTWTAPPTTSPTSPINVKVTLVAGGGGGGGGVKSNTFAGGGGGSGGASLGVFPVTGPVVVTVGSAGTAGAGAPLSPSTSNATSGGAGGPSSFGAFISATGGSGGGGAVASPTPLQNNGAGGAGGAGTGGSLTATGIAGSGGLGSTPGSGGSGGATRGSWVEKGGSGGIAPATSPGVQDGTAGTANTGAGGGGGATVPGPAGIIGGNGGAGAGGFVLVEW